MWGHNLNDSAQNPVILCNVASYLCEKFNLLSNVRKVGDQFFAELLVFPMQLEIWYLNQVLIIAVFLVSTIALFSFNSCHSWNKCDAQYLFSGTPESLLQIEQLNIKSNCFFHRKGYNLQNTRDIERKIFQNSPPSHAAWNFYFCKSVFHHIIAVEFLLNCLLNTTCTS